MAYVKTATTEEIEKWQTTLAVLLVESTTMPAGGNTERVKQFADGIAKARANIARLRGVRDRENGVRPSDRA
jgi:hypothetical protein